MHTSHFGLPPEQSEGGQRLGTLAGKLTEQATDHKLQGNDMPARDSWAHFLLINRTI